MEYVWLITLWLLFGLLHSIFAAAAIKQAAKTAMKNNYRYYRIAYSFFAVLSLTVVLWYHYSIHSMLLWGNSTTEKVIAIILFIPAIFIMAISIKKYFLNLSGMDVFLKHRAIQAQHLEQTGLHKYMRHPLYSGTLLFVWCIFLWQPSISNLITCSCITLYTRIGIYFEEKKLVRDFGDEYKLYALQVPMLVPGI